MDDFTQRGELNDRLVIVTNENPVREPGGQVTALGCGSSIRTPCPQTPRLGFQTAYLAVPDARATILRNVVQVESGLVPVPKPETGTDPTCLPLVVQDQADCAAALAGSCVDKFFGACWDPSGSCSILTSAASTSANLIPLSGPIWSNGARINMAADMTNPDAPSVVVSVVGSTGNVCAIGMSQSTGGACLVEVIYQASGKSLSICGHEDGTAELTCPDGTVIGLPTENCAFSKTNAADCQ